MWDFAGQVRAQAFVSLYPCFSTLGEYFFVIRKLTNITTLKKKNHMEPVPQGNSGSGGVSSVSVHVKFPRVHWNRETRTGSAGVDGPDSMYAGANLKKKERETSP